MNKNTYTTQFQYPGGGVALHIATTPAGAKLN